MSLMAEAMRLLIDWLRSAAKTRKRRSRVSGRLRVTLVCSLTGFSVARKYVESGSGLGITKMFGNDLKLILIDDIPDPLRLERPN